MSVEQKINELFAIRNHVQRLKERESRLIHSIHTEMNRRLVNEISTDAGILCKRSVVSRNLMRKTNIPEDVWDEYSEPLEYVRLIVKPE